MANANAPRVWIGCLQCYNEGRLVGDWYDASAAGDVTTSQLHGRPIPSETHEELWCLDVEGFPEAKEMGPTEAQHWGDLYETVGDTQWPAFCAWVRSGAYVEDGDGMPDQATFEEQYAGEWGSFDDYSYDFVHETAMLSDVPESIQQYFDYAAFARDLQHDYSVEGAPGGGVYVFHVS